MPALVDHGTRLALAGLALMAGSALQLQQAALWPVAAYAGLTAAGALLLVVALTLARSRPPAVAVAAAAAAAAPPAPAPTAAAALAMASGCRGMALPARRLRAAAHAAALVLMLVLAMLLLGFGGTGLRAAERLAEALSPALEGQDIEVTGTVAGLPRSSLSGTRFVFEVEQALHGGMPVDIPRRLSLGWTAASTARRCSPARGWRCAPASAGVSRCVCGSRTGR
jgi:competence protein ComEC